MKRIRVHYYCDVCSAEIESDETAVDYSGRNFGLCEACRERGYSLRTHLLDGDGESRPCVVRILTPEGEES